MSSEAASSSSVPLPLRNPLCSSLNHTAAPPLPSPVKRDGQRMPEVGRRVRPAGLLHRPVGQLSRGELCDERQAVLQPGPRLLLRRPMPDTQAPLLEAVRTRYPVVTSTALGLELGFHGSWSQSFIPCGQNGSTVDNSIGPLTVRAVGLL